MTFPSHLQYLNGSLSKYLRSLKVYFRAVYIIINNSQSEIKIGEKILTQIKRKILRKFLEKMQVEYGYFAFEYVFQLVHVPICVGYLCWSKP